MLEEGTEEDRRDIYQVAPLETCTRTWMTEKDLFEARARFGQDVIIADEDDDV